MKKIGDPILPQTFKFLISYAIETMRRNIYEYWAELIQNQNQQANQVICFCEKVRDMSIFKCPVKKEENRCNIIMKS